LKQKAVRTIYRPRRPLPKSRNKMMIRSTMLRPPPP
jgi:hypothetical protein